jgi:hypothetical protein
MMYPLVLDLADAIPVAVACRVLGFSKQAFYKWCANPVSHRDWEEAHLINVAYEVHADDPEFGYRFITDELAQRGVAAGENRVARLCSQQGIERRWFLLIVVKVRDGQVTNKPFYVVIGVTTAGERDILGIWAGDGGEGAKYWLSVLTEIKNRGVADVCIMVCDGLKGLPDAITTTCELGHGADLRDPPARVSTEAVCREQAGGVSAPR